MKYLVFGLSLIFLACKSESPAQPTAFSWQQAFPNLPTFSSPIELVHSGDGTNRLFVAQQRGLIYVFQNSSTVNTRKIFLDLSDRVSPTGGEAGLLGLAFHPNYRANGYFYVNYTNSLSGSLTSYIARYQVSPSNPDSAVKASEQILLTIPQPYSNHNGGKVAFGPDGYLYLGFGDGGSGNDPGNRAQNRAELLGKVLRIDVNSTSGGNNYAIPPTNPYAGNTQGWRQEIFAYGIRNPWKFSFDAETGALWLGDVGQDSREEVDMIVSGGNYGWRLMEGNICNPSVNPNCQDTAGLIRPVWDYPNAGSDVAVTGGYVYRGSAIPSLRGKYICGDYGSGKNWMLSYNGAGSATAELISDEAFAISTFGVDESNELYCCSYSSSGRIYKLTGPPTSAALGEAPSVFVLEQNYPNPFNPTTIIRFTIKNSQFTILKVLDLLGRDVATIVNEVIEPGTHAVQWNASGMASGVYLYQLSAGGLVQTKKLSLIR
ncbi:MAG: PQQ-dependent sugar dehydrogenase [Ignavibacteriae bacterium]|nr:PQQ-dependent sugar dehydrogenase [Ignavibacteriota bacterium]